MIAGKLEAFGPVQGAWQLSFTALAGALALSSANCDERGRAAPVDPLAAADAAADAWEAVGQPFPAAVALMHAARTALAARATREAASRLRRAAPLAERLGVGPLAAEIADLTRRAGADSDAGDPVLTGRETRGPAPRRGRAVQPGDRRRARHLTEDGERPRVEHPRQARRGHPHRGRRQGPPAAAALAAAWCRAPPMGSAAPLAARRPWPKRCVNCPGSAEGCS